MHLSEIKLFYQIQCSHWSVWYFEVGILEAVQDLCFFDIFLYKEASFSYAKLSQQYYELIRPALENFCKRINSRKYDLYNVFYAGLYVLKAVANDDKSQVIFQNNGQFITITKLDQLKAKPMVDSLLKQVLKKLSLPGKLIEDMHLYFVYYRWRSECQKHRYCWKQKLLRL